MNSWPILTQFNKGELSPLMEGRVDMDAYRKGCRSQRNFIPTVQGPAKRRGGLRYLGSPISDSRGSLMIPFVRSETEAYALELSGNIMRFWFDGAPVMSGPIIYQIATPYAAGDLFNADGSAQVQVVQSADVMYFVHPNYPPQKLSHFGITDWRFSAPTFSDGPWLPENDDDTTAMIVSAISGSGVTITASADVFSTNCVGQLIRIYQNDLSALKAWYPGQRTTGGNIGVGVKRRSGPNTYLCKSISSGTVPGGGTLDWIETGSDTLITTLGDQWDGPQDIVPNPATANHYYGRGVQWTYQDSGYGVARITARTDARHVTVNVLRQFPASLLIGDPTLVASVRWQLGAWSPDNGYPSACCFFRERLTFAGGIYVWMSVASDFENFADQDFGVVAQDNAVTQQVLSDQVNKVLWLDPTDDLLVGTTGSEHKIGQNTLNEPFGPLNVATKRQSRYGSRPIPPIRVGGSSFFVTRTGRYLREFLYSIETDSYESHDATVLSEHVTENGGIIAMQWAFSPDTVIWTVMQDGQLVGFTVNEDEKCEAWHPHTIGGSGKVISMAVIPSAAGDFDELYLCVQHTINARVFFAIERLEQAWRRDIDAQADAFYVDAGTTYNGPPAPTVTGLTWLEGATVSVFADGQPQADKTVLNGFITLDEPASVVQVGLAYPSWLEPMRIDGGATDGTSQGKIKRVNRVVFRFKDSLGGKYGSDPLNNMAYCDALSYSDPPTAISGATPFYTGDTPILAWPGGYEQDGYLGIYTDQPLPMTLCAIMCAEVTYEGWS